MLDNCYFTSWKQEANSGAQLREGVLCLITGHDCLLLVVLLLQAIVSQGSLDRILRKH